VLGTADIFLFEEFRLDRQGDGLSRRDESGVFVPVQIGSRALDILGVLVERPGELVSKKEIMAAVWRRTVVENANLTVQISALRRVLDHGRSDESCIQTVAARGYRFTAAVTAALSTRGLGSAPQTPSLSIVVLPFTILSDDPEQQYFADGLVDDLTTDLSRIDGMFVISRNTAFTYKGTAVNAKQISQELGGAVCAGGKRSPVRQRAPRKRSADRRPDGGASVGGTLRSRHWRSIRLAERDHGSDRGRARYRTGRRGSG
jgi:DNA-binding winged helix-turn-helix (wHTH) protein